MKHIPSILEDPSRFTSGIASTQEYLNERSQETKEAQLTRLQQAVRLGAFAQEAATKSERGYDTKESAVYRLIGHIDSFAEAQQQLDNLRNLEKVGTAVSYEEKEPHLRKVIGFNHAAKELVNLDPTIQFDDLTRFTTQIYLRQHALQLQNLTPEARQQRLHWFHNNTKYVLNGMRHELAYEQILGELQRQGHDLDYEETNEENELLGIDYIVTLEGVKLNVDVKATQKAASKKRAGVWSHIQTPDISHPADNFNGGFRISQETAAANAKAVLIDLYAIRQTRRVA